MATKVLDATCHLEQHNAPRHTTKTTQELRVKLFIWFDLTDYMLAWLKDITVGHLPGQLHRQQFVIQECEKCNIYVFNHSKTITINDCVICHIFRRSVKGSVFVRDCKHTQCKVACLQFHTKAVKRQSSTTLSWPTTSRTFSRRVHENSEQSCLFVFFAGEYWTTNTHKKRPEFVCSEYMQLGLQKTEEKDFLLFLNEKALGGAISFQQP
uniref:C-CAP/cofactor C-like domain-containing protein n=1 Tax=Amphiprion ocellaris TaxID=80972 RepID=A0AAQ5Y6R3_AMPOC